MKNSYGHFKYCVASVDTCLGTPTVSFYAYKNDAYGLHRVDNYNSPDIVWYENEADALKARWNSNDCVLCRRFD
jgi:hypothetical protein